MTSDEPKVSMTGKYPIGEATRLLCVARNTLRQYTRDGKIKCGWSRANGRRFYTGAELLRFWRATY